MKLLKSILLSSLLTGPVFAQDFNDDLASRAVIVLSNLPRGAKIFFNEVAATSLDAANDTRIFSTVRLTEKGVYRVRVTGSFKTGVTEKTFDIPVAPGNTVTQDISDPERGLPKGAPFGVSQYSEPELFCGAWWMYDSQDKKWLVASDGKWTTPSPALEEFRQKQSDLNKLVAGLFADSRVEKPIEPKRETPTPKPQRLNPQQLRDLWRLTSPEARDSMRPYFEKQLPGVTSEGGGSGSSGSGNSGNNGSSRAACIQECQSNKQICDEAQSHSRVFYDCQGRYSRCYQNCK